MVQHTHTHSNVVDSLALIPGIYRVDFPRRVASNVFEAELFLYTYEPDGKATATATATATTVRMLVTASQHLANSARVSWSVFDLSASLTARGELV